MKIEAISLWQPWASMTIPPGPKDFETRGWDTSYRGPLLICAAKGGLSQRALMALLMQPDFQEALWHLVPPYCKQETSIMHRAKMIFGSLSFGRAVTICNLVATYPTETIVHSQIETNLPFGDFSPGRFAWHLQDRKAINPFPVTCRPGLFEVEVPG